MQSRWPERMILLNYHKAASIKLTVRASQVQPAIIICNNPSNCTLINETHLESIGFNIPYNVSALKLMFFVINEKLGLGCHWKKQG